MRSDMLCSLLAAYILFAVSASASATLLNRALGDVANDPVMDVPEHSQQDIHNISDDRCLRLLDEVEMNEELREKVIDIVISGSLSDKKSVLTVCKALYDRPKSFVRRITQLLPKLGASQVVNELGVSARASFRNELGQAVFRTLPIEHDWQTDADGWKFARLGEFMDLNGDGLPDFIIPFFTDSGDFHYRATFINDGNYNWVMVACESNFNWPDRFAPCQGSLSSNQE